MNVTESKGFYRFNGSSEKNLDMFPPPPQTYVPSSPSFDTPYGKPVQNIKSVPSAHFSWQRRNWRSDEEMWYAPKQAVLPPIGVFWDIENCQIPHGKSALVVAQAIRAKFFEGYREAEFLVVCDVKKESNQVIQELNDAQVNLMHVCSKSKNAADEKLRQALRRFAEIHSFPSAIILISSDIDFATDLSDLRHRKKIHIILLHANSCSESLIMCANEHYNFGELVNPLPSRGSFQDTDQSTELVVWYPYNCDTRKVKMRLKYLSQNCGGKISFVTEFYAIISFPTMDSAIRAHKRMKGETLFGSEITITTPHLFLSKKNNGSYPTFTSFDGLEQKSRKRSLPLWYTPDERLFNGECKSFNEIGTYNTPQELLNNYVYMGFNVTNELFVSPWNRPHIITQNEQIINPSGPRNLCIEEISEQSSAFERFRNNYSGFSSKETANSELKISVLSNFHPVNNGKENVTHQSDPLINSTKDRQTAFDILLSIDESSMQSSVSETSTVHPDNEISSSLKPPLERSPSLLYSNSKEKQSVVAKNSILDDSISTKQNKHKIMGHCLKHTKKECVEECNDMTVSPLSKIVICLTTFSKNVRTLLHSHDNILPLKSFFYCYTTEFGELRISDEGVPLEHLVTCIDNVELSVSNGIKYLKPSANKMNEEFVDTGNLLPFRSETLTNALTIFCCEVIDLIKTQPYCQIPFDKFIKCYNQYFGRPCRLADYGFPHLKSLFEAVADVIQVMGESNSKIITLTHKTQMRRFALDFVRILRLQTDQKILLSELPSIFENILLHPFNPVDYGVCKVKDLISCISSSLLTSPTDNDIIIYLKTKQSKDKMCKLNKSQCLKKGRNKKESQSLTEKSDSVVTKLSNLSIAPSDVQPSSCSPNLSLQDKSRTSKSKRSQWETLLDSPPCDNAASSSISDLPPPTTSHTKKNGQLIISPDPSILPHPNIHLKSKPRIRHVDYEI